MKKILSAVIAELTTEQRFETVGRQQSTLAGAVKTTAFRTTANDSIS